LTPKLALICRDTTNTNGNNGSGCGETIWLGEDSGQ
jgi:hypothetical protein